MATEHQTDRQYDKTLADSFPASDPPGNSGVTGAEGVRKPPHDREHDERPTGMPTSDRHATKVAHTWEDEVKPSDRPTRPGPGNG
jgi:hypothetical protein